MLEIEQVVCVWAKQFYNLYLALLKWLTKNISKMRELQKL